MQGQRAHEAAPDFKDDDLMMVIHPSQTRSRGDQYLRRTHTSTRPEEELKSSNSIMLSLDSEPCQLESHPSITTILITLNNGTHMISFRKRKLWSSLSLETFDEPKTHTRLDPLSPRHEPTKNPKY